jgi:hypothetical protein
MLMSCFSPPALFTGHWIFELVLFSVSFALLSYPVLLLFNSNGLRSRLAHAVAAGILAAIPMGILIWLSWVWGVEEVRNDCGLLVTGGNLTAYGWLAAAVWLGGYSLYATLYGVFYHWMAASDAVIDERI